MSRPLTSSGLTHRSFPRVSGDEPGRVVRELCQAEFSPRERG